MKPFVPIVALHDVVAHVILSYCFLLDTWGLLLSKEEKEGIETVVNEMSY